MFSDFYSDFIDASRGLPEEFRTEDAAKRYFLHLEGLLDKGKKFNLTAITDERGATRLHVVDSLYAAKTVKELSKGDASLIDVGSGGGFPSLPIAISCPDVSVTALDSTAKKCIFISSVAALCGVDVKTLPVRAEEAPPDLRESFDFAAARAVARLNVLAELCSPFVKVGGYFLAMKGSAARAEAEEAKDAASRLGLSLEGSCDYFIDGGGQRSILIYKKVSPTPEEFPRSFSKIKKRPL